MANKHVDLFKEMIPAVDIGAKELWNLVDDDGRKEIKNDMWNLNRYISNVGTPKYKGSSPSRDVQEHYVITVNEYYNKHWNLLQKEHSKLLWQLLCMCSYDGERTFYHEWLPLKRTKGVNDKKLSFLAELHPNRKMDELEMLSQLLSDAEIKEMAIAYGMEDNLINKKLK